jgi:hypothetical protein
MIMLQDAKLRFLSYRQEVALTVRVSEHPQICKFAPII